MAILNKKDSGYAWEFENIGGSTRVKITSGEDILHLSELDRKMWTVLSSPVKGLEIDDRSLAYIDSDNDGKIHLDDVVRTAGWITEALKNADLLLEGEDHIDINEINAESGTGKRLYCSARQILRNLGKDTDVLSLADIADSSAIFASTRFNGDGIITEASSDNPEDKEAILSAISTVGNVIDRSGAPGINAPLTETFYKALADYARWLDAAPELPFGEKTEAALAAYNALDAKVRDFFMRSRLAAFAPDTVSALDVQTSRIEAISADNLNMKAGEIASYPIARVTGKAEIDLDGALNPAWTSDFATLRSVVLEGSTVNEDVWNAAGDRFAAYTAWKDSREGSVVEPLGEEKIRELLRQDRKEAVLALIAKDAELKEESESIDEVDKFLHIYRDFYRLLKNFVTFQDFYNPDKCVKAIFQAGTLLIDQRSCRFCIDVADAAKHNVMAPASGMFLVYCDCVAKTKPGVRKIAAAVTVGDIGDLSVGKNAIFYDNSGLDWDATVTKIIDNPICISQAFWSPYRRMAQAVENFINKSAADKDAKIIAETSKKITEAPANAPVAAADVKTAAPPFDIAKFAGIFAALGMALGMIGSFFVSLAKGFVALTWWQAILVIIGIMLLISGPSMIMAWLKLRRRNIAPLLNANGWAINASSSISIPFGATLTDIVKFPKLKLKDPYARKGIPTWKKWCISIGIIAIVAVALWLCNLLAWASLPSPFCS